MSRKNFVQVQLAAAATDIQTTLTIKAPRGGFTLPPSDGGRLIITDSPGQPTAFEVVTYTGISGTGPYTLTGVTRGVEGTVGMAWPLDAFVFMGLTAGEFDGVIADLQTQLDDKAASNDARLSDAREWTAITVSQAEAEAGTATTRRAWTAQRVAQAARGVILTGYALGSNAALAATDTLLAALGKLQAQINAKLDASATAVAANKLATARTISLTGDATGSATFDGSANASITVAVQDDSHAHTIANIDGLQTALDGKQASLGFTPVQQGTGAGQSANTVRMGWSANGLLLQVDATDFANVWPISIGKNAATATKLQTARTINGVAFDGSANITISDSTKLPLTGGTATGPVLFSGNGSGNGVQAGNGDNASSTANNLKLSSWFGIGFGPSITGQAVPNGEYSHWFNVRTGDMGLRGSLVAWGNITAYSDTRVKTNIQVIPNALNKVTQLRGVTYERIDRDGERQTGLIAQEVQKVMPEAVSGDDMLSVAYGNLVGLLVEAIKELDAKVEALRDGTA